MAVKAGRDLEVTRKVLQEWLAARLAVPDVEVRDLSIPKAGYSNETVYLHAAWTPADGPAQEADLVLRIEPTGHQLFVKPDAIFQARMMQTLAGHPGVPVPHILFTETDPTILGSPFYVMEKVVGRVPGDVPSWHRRGWTVDLSPAERTRLHDNGMAALVALHRIDLRDGFEFLDPGAAEPGAGTALDRYLDHLRKWHVWAGPSLAYEPELLAASVNYLLAERPDDPSTGIVWGDARVGNICFGEDLSVVAMFDWEAATAGPPGIDLGWWLMFEEFLCEAQGYQRLEGVPGRDGMIARYQELGGAAVERVEYYELLAATVLSLVNSRLAELLIAGGLAPEIADQYPTWTLRMVRRGLTAAGVPV